MKEAQKPFCTGAALEPDVARAVQAMGEAPYVDLDSLPLEQALARVRFPVTSAPPPNTEDRWIEIVPGRNMRVRLYFPELERNKLPVLMHLHGGGFVTGTVEMDDLRCARLARDAGCIVASVDYPLAPEAPFPEPIEGAFSAWTWITQAAGDFGGDPRRAVVSGSSAGGHLAIGVCLLARDRRVPMPLLQLLTYPVVSPELDTDSYRQFANGPFLTRARMAWFWKHYGSSAEPSGPLWSPLGALLAGLPPALVITAEFDVLRDEAEDYAARLRAEGMAARVHRYPGMIHGFVTTLRDHPSAAAALDESSAALRDAFARAS